MAETQEAQLAKLEAERQTRETLRWAIRNGDLCTVWGDLRSGREKCYSVRRNPDGRFVTSGGNVFEIRDAGV